MGIPTYSTEKPSNSPTLPSPVTLCTETDIHTHCPTHTHSSERLPSSPLTSPSTAPVETNTNPAMTGGGGPASGQEPHVLTPRPAGEESLTQEVAHRLYEERMEEEYAKREGGRRGGGGALFWIGVIIVGEGWGADAIEWSRGRSCWVNASRYRGNEKGRFDETVSMR
ncbi:hypothetical protein BGX38DRAFT_1267336 [Terfezia claveryi]|nr:hypothetical protein BGX38DRAFT_1267336 [Terfezia claveryi]